MGHNLADLTTDRLGWVFLDLESIHLIIKWNEKIQPIIKWNKKNPPDYKMEQKIHLIIKWNRQV